MSVKAISWLQYQLQCSVCTQLYRVAFQCEHRWSYNALQVQLKLWWQKAGVPAPSLGARPPHTQLSQGCPASFATLRCIIRTPGLTQSAQRQCYISLCSTVLLFTLCPLQDISVFSPPTIKTLITCSLLSKCSATLLWKIRHQLWLSQKQSSEGIVTFTFYVFPIIIQSPMGRDKALAVALWHHERSTEIKQLSLSFVQKQRVKNWDKFDHFKNPDHTTCPHCILVIVVVVLDLAHFLRFNFKNVKVTFSVISPFEIPNDLYHLP